MIDFGNLRDEREMHTAAAVNKAAGRFKCLLHKTGLNVPLREISNEISVKQF